MNSKRDMLQWIGTSFYCSGDRVITDNWIKKNEFEDGGNRVLLKDKL